MTLLCRSLDVDGRKSESRLAATRWPGEEASKREKGEGEGEKVVESLFTSQTQSSVCSLYLLAIYSTATPPTKAPTTVVPNRT
jgi:hypothetical protein